MPWRRSGGHQLEGGALALQKVLDDAAARFEEGLMAARDKEPGQEPASR